MQADAQSEANTRTGTGIPSLFGIIEWARGGLEASLHGLVAGDGAPVIDYDNPRGDPGLFGPDSVTWRVHSDFPAMLAGGISSLMLQALHPLAMAGVYEHSNFRADPLLRLRRTATFVGATTYAGTATAEKSIAAVRRIHKSVVGTAPDGRPYSANDPRLLTWVHTAEVASFLKGYIAYSGDSLTATEQDQYFAEIARLAEGLGARDVPTSVTQVNDYFRAMRPELVWGAQAKESIEFLFRTPSMLPTLGLGLRMFIEVGIDLLPDWAQEMTNLRKSQTLPAIVMAPTFRTAAAIMRWSISTGAPQRARARMGLPATPAN
ncbi:MAG TPA: oxygenase MpaB family protein [Candidatus Binataceae bacterium]|nr:oxygenase MpaB family protein [Candidatus Binataceae bacterium]